MAILDEDGTIRYANPAAAWLIGRAPARLVGVPVLALIHNDDRRRMRRDFQEVVAGRGTGKRVEYRLQAVDGSWKTISAVASDLSDLSSTSGVLVSAIDVTEQRTHERSLRRLALTDPITGLPNRVALHDRLASGRRSQREMSVVFVDLDHFRRVNDCLGHTVGDEVLHVAASRIGTLVPAASMLAHFGADSFVIVLAEIGRERAVELVWEILAQVANAMFVSGHEVRMTASAGVAFWDAASTAESIVRDADMALTRAKANRRGGVEVFTEELRTQAVTRLALETDLRRAVEREEFEVHFQPVVNLASGIAEGCEALIRWTRPDGGPVSPETFIPIAEETELIIPIGEWVLHRSVKAVRSGVIPRVSVNLSPRQLLDPGLPARIERLLHAHDVRPELISFEITEAVLIDNFPLAIDCLNRLRELGIAVGLDDFGTGYSSLGYLRRLPVDFLKLDRQLVAEVDTDLQAAAIAGTIVSLARTLALVTIAEGIERQRQADILADQGCHYGQGWLFGRPRGV